MQEQLHIEAPCWDDRVLLKHCEDFDGLKQALMGIVTKYCCYKEVFTFANPHTSFDFGNHRLFEVRKDLWRSNLTPSSKRIS